MAYKGPDRFADTLKRLARIRCFASVRERLHPQRTTYSLAPWQSRAPGRKRILPMAIIRPAVFRRLARDIDATAATVPAHPPDNEKRAAAAACEGSRPVRCPCRRVEEGLDGNKAWWRFRSARAPPPACIPAGQLRATQAASRAALLCPLPCSPPLSAIVPSRRGPWRCTPHPSMPAVTVIAGRANLANRTGRHRLPSSPISPAIATRQIVASGARSFRSLEIRAQEFRVFVRSPANPLAQKPDQTTAREISRPRILRFARLAAGQN